MIAGVPDAATNVSCIMAMLVSQNLLVSPPSAGELKERRELEFESDLLEEEEEKEEEEEETPSSANGADGPGLALPRSSAKPALASCRPLASLLASLSLSLSFSLSFWFWFWLGT